MTIQTEKLILLTNNAGIELDKNAVLKLDLYAERLIETNKQFNLTAITGPDEILYKHFLDSLMILRYIIPKSGERWIDVGTGAGIPGFPILAASPGLQMTFLDGTKKKLQFIQDTLQAAGMQGKTVHARAEKAGQEKEYREQYDYVSARAVAHLRELTEYCLPFLKIGGYFVAMKSKKTEEEIQESQRAIHLLGGKIKQIETFQLDNVGERTLIFIEKISHTPPKFPRPSAKIAKQPLKS